MKSSIAEKYIKALKTQQKDAQELVLCADYYIQSVQFLEHLIRTPNPRQKKPTGAPSYPKQIDRDPLEIVTSLLKAVKASNEIARKYGRIV